MKKWMRSVLPLFAVATGGALSGTSVAAETGASNVAGRTSAPPATGAASSQYWMARSGLPAHAAHALQAEIDAQIASYGGVQVSPYEVAYGRMLQFESCGTQSLATYGFADMTSSWVDNTSSYVTVYNDNHAELWSEAPGAASISVGGANDQAYTFWIIC